MRSQILQDYIDWLDPVWSTKYNFITHHIPPDIFNEYVCVRTYLQVHAHIFTYTSAYMCAFCFGLICQEVVGKHASLIDTLRPHPAMIFVCSKQKHYLLGNPCVSLPTACGVSSGLISYKIQIPQCESLLTSSMVSATKLDDVSRCTFYGRNQISTETLRPSIKWPLVRYRILGIPPAESLIHKLGPQIQTLASQIQMSSWAPTCTVLLCSGFPCW